MEHADRLALAGLRRLAKELYRESAKSARPLGVQLERSADILSEGIARGELHSTRVRMTVYWLACYDAAGSTPVPDAIVTGATAVFELLDRPVPTLRAILVGRGQTTSAYRSVEETSGPLLTAFQAAESAATPRSSSPGE